MSSYISTIVTPTIVIMHTIEPSLSDDKSEGEADAYLVVDNDEDISELSAKQLELLVQMLSSQLMKTTKPAACTASACAIPCKKKPDTPVPSVPAASSTSAPPQPASTNLSAAPNSTPKPTVAPQTVMPQVHSSDPKEKAKDAVGPDFHYQSPIKDKGDAKKVVNQLLNVSVPITMRELLSLFPDIQKHIKESTTIKKVKATAFVGIDPVSNYFQTFKAFNCHNGLVITKESHALWSIIPIINRHLAVKCILDSDCQIVGMSKAVWMTLSKQLNLKHTVSMQSANGTIDRSLGIVENLSFRFGTIELQLQVHVIEDPVYDILLGRPFDIITKSAVKNFHNEDQTITITDPNDPHRIATIETHPGEFLNIDDLSTKARGDALECFNIMVHNLSNSQPCLDVPVEFDTAAIEGFVICIQFTPSLPSIVTDFTIYLVSASGPIVPTLIQSFIVEYQNDDMTSPYYRVLLSPSAQIAACEQTLSHSLVFISANRTFLDILPISPSPSDTITNTADQVFKYKPIAKKVQLVTTTLSEEFRATRQIIGDPLAGMPTLSPTSPNFTPIGRYNKEACDIMNTNHSGDFLLPEEWKLMHHFILVFEQGFAWNESQKGRFCDDFFPLIKISIIPHVPWALRNILIPPGIYNNVLKIIQDKITSGTYKPSSLSYRSCWFMVLKKNGKLHIVQDLQPLNTVTI